MKYVVVSEHSSYGDDALPIGVYDTLSEAKEAAETKYPTLKWDEGHEGLDCIKLSGEIGNAEYLSVIEVPHNQLAERE